MIIQTVRHFTSKTVNARIIMYCLLNFKNNYSLFLFTVVTVN